jgi:hypothetical protein
MDPGFSRVGHLSRDSDVAAPADLQGRQEALF